MIDVHSHILPGIDDGSPNLATSLEMARQAVSDGITAIVCTPHGNSSNLVQMLQARDTAMEQLRQALSEQDIPLRLYPGLEYCADGHSVECACSNPRCRYNSREDGPILVELPFDIELSLVANLLFEASSRGCPFVLAHAERYHGFVEMFNQLDEWMDRGLNIQFNAPSLLSGFFTRKLPRSILKLMERHPDQVLLATDAHSAQARPECLTVARKPVVSALGEAFWKKLTEDNPREILLLD